MRLWHSEPMSILFWQFCHPFAGCIGGKLSNDWGCHSTASEIKHASKACQCQSIQHASSWMLVSALYYLSLTWYRLVCIIMRNVPCAFTNFTHACPLFPQLGFLVSSGGICFKATACNRTVLLSMATEATSWTVHWKQRVFGRGPKVLGLKPNSTGIIEACLCVGQRKSHQ